MKDFILAALPFIIMGISIVIIVINSKKNKENKESKEKESYILEGMCFGMSAGLLLETQFLNEYMGMFLSLGMLIGEAIGFYIRKK